MLGALYLINLEQDLLLACHHHRARAKGATSFLFRLAATQQVSDFQSRTPVVCAIKKVVLSALIGPSSRIGGEGSHFKLADCHQQAAIGGESINGLYLSTTSCHRLWSHEGKSAMDPFCVHFAIF